MNHPETLVATVLGWKCCCDVELEKSPSAGETWIGSANSKKDRTGVIFDLQYSPNNGEDVLQGNITSPHGQLKLDVLGRNRVFEFSVGEIFGKADEEDRIPRSRIRIIIGEHAELKRAFKNYAFGLSYMPVVWEQFRENPPRRILEWGPGRSTIFFAELFPETKIDGIEHNERWFKKCRDLEETFPDQVKIVHRHLEISPSRAQHYVTEPLYGKDKYDLIFVDGRLRCDCAALARFVLNDQGTVLVHDAHRKVYQPVYSLYSHAEIIYNTAILSECG